MALRVELQANDQLTVPLVNVMYVTCAWNDHEMLEDGKCGCGAHAWRMGKITILSLDDRIKEFIHDNKMKLISRMD